MSKTTPATRKTREPKATGTNGSVEPKQKRPRKAATGFTGDLRALAAKHRAKLARIFGPERMLEQRLNALRAQRAEAEGMLLEVEEMLSRTPTLPGMEGGASELPAVEETAAP